MQRGHISLGRIGAKPRWRFWMIPATVAVVWAVAVTITGRWSGLPEQWAMTLTMVFGSFIAGATSEGGGAVAFPVMTLVLGIEPHVARDFALMIQTVGMTTAACAIVLSRTTIEWRAIAFAGAGGAVGIVIGIQWLAGLLPPAMIKLGFVSLWLSFLLALWLINRDRDRPVSQQLPRSTRREIALLMGVGLLGGVVSGLTGSGLDIVTFSLLVLWGRVSESVATPTSVVLMAGNAAVGFAYLGGTGALAPMAWEYWWACVPVVIWGAPLGALFIKRCSRLLIARILYTSIVFQFVGALLILPMTPARILFATLVFSGGSLLFVALAAQGRKRLELQPPALAIASPTVAQEGRKAA